MPLFYRATPPNIDPYFANVSLLLRGTGTSRANIILDESPNQFPTTIVGNTSLSSAVKKYGNYSMKFDGSGDYLTIPASSAFNFGSGDFTIEAWIYMDSLPVGNGYPSSYWIVGGGPAYSSPGFDIAIGSTNIQVGLTNFAALNINTAHGMSAGVWYHVAVVRSGNVLYCFKDGNLLASADVTGVVAQSMDNGVSISAAEPVGSTSGNFNGYIDDLRITKGVARYTSNFTPPSNELPNSSLDDPNFSNVSLLLRGVGDIPVVGTILDESPNLFTTTIIGNTGLSSVIKKYGNYSIRFDGNGDYLTIPASSAFNFGSGDFTIEAWVYMNSLPGGNGYPSSYWIVGGGPVNDNAGFDIAIGSTNIQIGLTNFIGLNINTAHGMSAGVWYHIAVVRNGNNLYCFKDGNLLASADVTGVTAQSMNTGISISAAEPVGSTGGNFNGYIDDLRITKGIARYTSNFTAPTQELPNS